MTPDQLELAITQYLDGTLPPEDRSALEAKLAGDPDARALLAEQARLTALLRAGSLPPLEWDELAKDFSAVVTGTVEQSARSADQKLNSLLKTAVAPLPDIRWDALASTISASIDSAVGARDQHDEALDRALRSLDAPAVRWERLAAHLSQAVAAQDAAEQAAPQRRAEPQAPRPGVYSLKWVRRASQLALAACIVIASIVGIRMSLHRQDPSRPPVAIAPTAPRPLTIIQVQAPEKPAAPAVAQIEIGPSEAFVKAREAQDLYDSGFASGRSQIVIALPVSVGDDPDRGYGSMFD